MEHASSSMLQLIAEAESNLKWVGWGTEVAGMEETLAVEMGGGMAEAETEVKAAAAAWVELTAAMRGVEMVDE